VTDPLRAYEIVHRLDHKFAKRPEGKKGCAVCGRAKTNMDHVGVPKSLNVHGSGANRFVYQAQKKAWAERLTELLLACGLPRGLGHVHVEGQLCFPDRTRRDQGNYRFMVEKSLGDALKEGGWLPDDDWSHYEFGGLAYRYEAGVSFTRLMLMPSWEPMALEGRDDLRLPVDVAAG
jgi:hypothetical protein